MELTFLRRSYAQLWLEVISNEPLLMLQSGGYIEDYFGVGSQVTLRNTTTNDRQELLFTDNSATDLQGYLDLNDIENGTYALEGRVSDLVGNTTIIGAVSSTSITGDTIEVLLSISSGSGIGIAISTAIQTGSLSFRIRLLDSIPYETLGFQTSLSAPSFYFPMKFATQIDPLIDELENP